MENTDTVLLTFSETLEGLKADKTYARKGWNGKNLTVKLMSALEDRFNGYDFNPFFIIINSDSSVINPWVPSVSDILAEDWYEVI